MAKYIQVGAYDTPTVSKRSGAKGTLPKVATFVLDRYSGGPNLVALQASLRQPKDSPISSVALTSALAGSSRTPSPSAINIRQFADPQQYGTKPIISKVAAEALVDKFMNRTPDLQSGLIAAQKVGIGTESTATIQPEPGTFGTPISNAAALLG